MLLFHGAYPRNHDHRGIFWLCKCFFESLFVSVSGEHLFLFVISVRKKSLEPMASLSLEALLEAGSSPPAEGGKIAYEHPLVERYVGAVSTQRLLFSTAFHGVYQRLLDSLGEACRLES